MGKTKMCPSNVDNPKPKQVKQTQSTRVSKKAARKPVVQKQNIPKPGIPVPVLTPVPRPQAPPTCDPVAVHFYQTYKVSDEIGVGGFGTVHSATRRSDNLEVAVKMIPNFKIKDWISDPTTGTRVPTEVALLQKCQRAVGVINLVEYLQTRYHAILIMERIPNFEDLFNYIEAEEGQRLHPSKARIIVNQIVNTLSQCQALGVIHRDLKQENVLVNKFTGKVKLIDFGLAQLISQPNQELGVFHGTAVFKPPEYIIKRKSFADSLTVWSIGCFAYSLLFVDVPFQDDMEIVKGVLDESKLATVPRDCRDFIVRCLHPNPEARPLLKNLVNHPWLKNLNQSQMYHKQPNQLPNATYEVIRFGEVNQTTPCGSKSGK